jgi:hypothetical protein
VLDRSSAVSHRAYECVYLQVSVIRMNMSTCVIAMALALVSPVEGRNRFHPHGAFVLSKTQFVFYVTVDISSTCIYLCIYISSTSS